jgi:hypothetical protein
MSLIGGLVEDLEQMKVPNVPIVIDDKELQKIAMYVIITVLIIAIIKGVFNKVL